MCGICGIFNPSIDFSIDNMLNALKDRGPDDCGFYRNDNVILGMTRLSIIDTSKNGHQPMSNKEKTIWIIFNGEIFNFKEKRKFLESKGFSFISETDTEVILYLYQYYGIEFLNHLRGMFAIAIYDIREGKKNAKLIIARDQFGIKPLLFSIYDKQLIFSSEIKSMLSSGLIPKTIDLVSLNLYLLNGSIPQPRTIIKNVNMLLPGHYIICYQNKIIIKCYWSLESCIPKSFSNLSYKKIKNQLNKKLRKIVELNMISDVPLGAFLSGGIDSSVLVALMNERKKIKTFSIGYQKEGLEFDETNDATRIAKHIKTDHKNFLISGDDVRNNIHDFVRCLDQPSIDGLNSYFTSKVASKELRVVLSGLGADELFCGYPWFVYGYIYNNKNKNRTIISKIKQSFSKLLSMSFFRFLYYSRLSKLIEYTQKWNSLESFLLRQIGFFSLNEIQKLIIHKELLNNIPLNRSKNHHLFVDNPLSYISIFTLKNYTLNQLLRDADTVSMDQSLEIRVPFLDVDLFEFLLSIPEKYKINPKINHYSMSETSYKESGQKRILFDISNKLLPIGMRDNVKKGFGMPMDYWLNGALKEMVISTLSKKNIEKMGLFDTEIVENIVNKYYSKKTNWTKIWLILIMTLWYSEVLEKY